MFYVTGDTHGDQCRLIYDSQMGHWSKWDTIFVCGDFGYLFRNNETEKNFLDDLERQPFCLCFVDGNHENFPAIYAYPEEMWNGGRIHRIRKNVIHLMRGQVYTIEGKTFFTMGGAYSIDRWFREKDVSYWEEELPSQAEYQEARKNLSAHKNQVDYILTHTAPLPIIHKMGLQPAPGDLELTRFLTDVYYDVTFRHWYCGHWHRDQDMADNFTVLWFDVRELSG